MRNYFKDDAPAPAAAAPAAPLPRDRYNMADVNPRTLQQLMSDNPEGTGMIGAALLGMWHRRRLWPAWAISEQPR